MQTPPTIPMLRNFAVIFVLGPPGAGKGTLCTHLARTHNLKHYSVGDSLRSWMRENRTAPLAVQIQDKVDNQGFLDSEYLNPFILQAIKDALYQAEPELQGILIDGFPRDAGQLEGFLTWPFIVEQPLVPSYQGAVMPIAKPDIVLCFSFTKENARARYLARARDSNDSEEKFERRFAEYEDKTVHVEQVYRQRRKLIDIDSNGTREENVDTMTKTLGESRLWQKIMVEGRSEAYFLV